MIRNRHLSSLYLLIFAILYVMLQWFKIGCAIGRVDSKQKPTPTEKSVASKTEPLVITGFNTVFPRMPRFL